MIVRALLEQVGKWVNPTGTGTYDEHQALAAAKKLKKKLGDPEWLESIGVGYSTHQGFYVVALFKASSGDENEAAAWDALPTDVDGVKVLPSAAPTNRVVGPTRGASAGSLHQGLELLDALATVICEADPQHVEHVARMLQHRFGGRDWFVSAKANRAKDGVRLTIAGKARRPNLPKDIQRVPIRIERSEAKPAIATETVRRISPQKMFEAPPGTPPKLTNPGEQPPENPLDDPLIATAVTGYANARLVAARARAKALSGQNILPTPDEDKDDDAATKARDVLTKITKGRGIPEPRLKLAMKQKLPPASGITGSYRFDPITKKFVYR